MNYPVKIVSLEGGLQGLKREILSIDDYEECKERASRIEQSLFEASVTISCLTEETKKKPIVLPMSGINLPRIKIPTFDGNIFNWRLFWEQFQATVHDKPHLEEVDKVTYLRDALKDGPARNVVQGLTQTAESYQDTVRCLKDHYDRPRLIHREHVWSIVQAPPMKAGNGKEIQRLYHLWN